MNRYLIYIIPLFLFFVIFEMAAGAIAHRKVYKFQDTITNLSLGIGQQIIEALIKTFFSFLFLWVYKNSIFKIPDSILTLLTVVLICDFIFYWFHRLSHTVNILWAIHIVHHQSREFNLSVSLRQPWLHKFAMFAFYLIIPLIGISPGIMILAFAIQTFSQFWLHTRFIGKLGILENILVTPSHHRVHHGANDIYINKNYGNTLIIWDKLFGTFQEEEEQVVFGITKPFISTDPIWANLYFWKDILEIIKKKKGFLKKLKVLFTGPETVSIKELKIAKKTHIDPVMPTWLKWYVIFQFILIFTATFFYLLMQDSFSFILKSIAAIFIIWSLYNFSNLMQGKRNSLLSEFIRMVVGGFILYLFL